MILYLAPLRRLEAGVALGLLRQVLVVLVAAPPTQAGAALLGMAIPPLFHHHKVIMALLELAIYQLTPMEVEAVGHQMLEWPQLQVVAETVEVAQHHLYPARRKPTLAAAAAVVELMGKPEALAALEAVEMVVGTWEMARLQPLTQAVEAVQRRQAAQAS